MEEYYRDFPGCAGRSLHRFAEEVSRRYEGARTGFARFLGRRDPRGVVFVRNATEAINLVGQGLTYERGDRVLVTDREHNSNLVIWQRLAVERGIRLDSLALPEDGSFDGDALESELEKGVRLGELLPHVQLGWPNAPDTGDHGASARPRRTRAVRWLSSGAPPARRSGCDRRRLLCDLGAQDARTDRDRRSRGGPGAGRGAAAVAPRWGDGGVEHAHEPRAASAPASIRGGAPELCRGHRRARRPRVPGTRGARRGRVASARAQLERDPRLRRRAAAPPPRTDGPARAPEHLRVRPRGDRPERRRGLPRRRIRRHGPLGDALCPLVLRATRTARERPGVVLLLQRPSRRGEARPRPRGTPRADPRRPH